MTWTSIPVPSGGAAMAPGNGSAAYDHSIVHPAPPCSAGTVSPTDSLDTAACGAAAARINGARKAISDDMDGCARLRLGTRRAHCGKIGAKT